MENIRIISGMQTGADIAGVKFAKDFGYKYNGYMPKGYRTEKGSKPEYADLYNAIESYSYNYSVRTEKNVKNSNLTIIFDFANSSGSKLTKKLCKKYSKDFFYFRKESDKDIIGFLQGYFKSVSLFRKGITINIAGNRESKSPGIEKRVYNILKKVFNV